MSRSSMWCWECVVRYLSNSMCHWRTYIQANHRNLPQLSTTLIVYYIVDMVFSKKGRCFRSNSIKKDPWFAWKTTIERKTVSSTYKTHVVWILRPFYFYTFIELEQVPVGQCWEKLPLCPYQHDISKSLTIYEIKRIHVTNSNAFSIIRIILIYHSLRPYFITYIWLK